MAQVMREACRGTILMSDDSKECPTCGTACEVCWTEDDSDVSAVPPPGDLQDAGVEDEPNL